MCLGVCVFFRDHKEKKGSLASLSLIEEMRGKSRLIVYSKKQNTHCVHKYLLKEFLIL